MKQAGPEDTPLVDIGTQGLRANLQFAGLVIVLLPLLIGLGFWQLQRAGEKAQELAGLEAQHAAPRLGIDNFSAYAPAALDGRRVELRGRYHPERSFLLDNRILRGRVGYELLTLFRDQSGATVLVDRGWLPAPPTRDRLPEFKTPLEALTLTGEFYVPEDRRQLAVHPGDGWPRVIQALDLPELGRLADEAQLFAHLIVLDEGQPGVSEGDHARVNMAPERHRAYALQWFLMAVALLIVFVLGGTNARDCWRARRLARRARNADH